MEIAFEKVQPYNQSLAKKYLSEGVVDADFATGKSSNTSIRLSHERIMHDQANEQGSSLGK